MKDHSKKILKKLAEKPALPMGEIYKNPSLPPLIREGETRNPPDKGDKRGLYAINRSLRGLREAGLIEEVSSHHQSFLRLTKAGKSKVNALKLTSPESLVSANWDGLWRIILLDLPEERKAERESLRYLLKKAGFICLKNSAWISPLPYEHLFQNIKKDLGLQTELMIIVTSFIDEETKKYLFDIFGK